MAKQRRKSIRKNRGRRRPQKMKRKSKATIYYDRSVNEHGHLQVCVFAECHLSALKVGPVWGHGKASLRRALGELTEKCDCPAEYHQAKRYEGFPVVTPRKKKQPPPP